MIRVERAGDGRLGIVDDEDVILFLFFFRGELVARIEWMTKMTTTLEP